MIPGAVNTQGVRSGGGGGASTPQAAAYFAAMTVKPDGKTAAAIDSLIATLVKAGIWAKLNYLHLIAIHDAGAAIINAVAPAGTKGSIDDATFAKGKGVTTSGFIGSRFAPGILSSVGNSSDFSWGVYLKEMAQNSQWFAGIYRSPAYHMLYSGSPFFVYPGSNSYSSPGVYLDGYVSTHFLNGVSGVFIGSTFYPSNGNAGGQLYSEQLTLGTTTGDSIGSTGARFLSDFLGKSMTAAEHQIMREALETYFKTIGAL